MGWISRVKNEWGEMGILARVGWLSSVVLPLIWSIWSRGGWKTPTFEFYSIFNLALYILLVALLIQNRRLTKNLRNKELENLIKPLYLAFDKYPRRNDSTSSLIHILSSLTELSNNPIYQTSVLRELADTAYLAVNTMKQHRELAQPRLQEIIDEYLEMRKNDKEISILKSYGEAEKKLNEIVNLVNKRYHELTDVT